MKRTIYLSAWLDRLSNVCFVYTRVRANTGLYYAHESYNVHAADIEITTLPIINQ